jgi:hypothetical protein
LNNNRAGGTFLQQGKELDKDIKTLSIKAANLPESGRHIDDEDEDEKDLFVDTKVIERINKARFERKCPQKNDV